MNRIAIGGQSIATAKTASQKHSRMTMLFVFLFLKNALVD
jgi:preprotein translocase subunit SecG